MTTAHCIQCYLKHPAECDYHANQRALSERMKERVLNDIPDLVHTCKSCRRSFAEWRLHTYLSGSQGYCCPFCGNSKPQERS